MRAVDKFKYGVVGTGTLLAASAFSPDCSIGVCHA
jgi:hypothetical protein